MLTSLIQHLELLMTGFTNILINSSVERHNDDILVFHTGFLNAPGEGWRAGTASM
jgi:hypothetical protein